MPAEGLLDVDVSELDDVEVVGGSAAGTIGGDGVPGQLLSVSGGVHGEVAFLSHEPVVSTVRPRSAAAGKTMRCVDPQGQLEWCRCDCVAAVIGAM